MGDGVETLAPPDVAKLKIFISYSRRDSIADVLVDALIARHFEVTIDRRHLEFGEKWQVELADFIRLSDTVIWLLSEGSIRSEWVNWELDEVARRNKRLVPVMVGGTPRDKLPRQLGEIHILPADGTFDLARDLDQLVRVLETDRAWLKEASRLADRAHEWIGKDRDVCTNATWCSTLFGGKMEGPEALQGASTGTRDTRSHPRQPPRRLKTTALVDR
ncbi:MAG: toll/interleukin-1 receptor domain-containing protein [Hyphomicrobium sp.]